jgi:hypothetical protein
VCGDQLARQTRASLMTYSALIDWLSSGGHMMEDGVFRAADFLGSVAAGGLRARAEVTDAGRARDDAARRRAVQLAAVLLAVSLLVAGTGEPPRAGVNLFTAASLFAASTALLLWRTLRRLT